MFEKTGHYRHRLLSSLFAEIPAVSQQSHWPPPNSGCIFVEWIHPPTVFHIHKVDGVELTAFGHCTKFLILPVVIVEFFSQGRKLVIIHTIANPLAECCRINGSMMEKVLPDPGVPTTHVPLNGLEILQNPLRNLPL